MRKNAFLGAHAILPCVSTSLLSCSPLPRCQQGFSHPLERVLFLAMLWAPVRVQWGLSNPLVCVQFLALLWAPVAVQWGFRSTVGVQPSSCASFLVFGGPLSGCSGGSVVVRTSAGSKQTEISPTALGATPPKPSSSIPRYDHNPHASVG